MLKQLNHWSMAAYIKGKNLIRDLKSDERGLSGIVVAVLLILVAGLAVVVLWNVLKPWITETFEKLTLPT